MKHYLHNSLRALFLSLAVLLSLPMLAEQVMINGINYELNAEAKQATVVSKSDKYSGEIVIPESVEHEGSAYSVTSIGKRAFQNCYGLTSVTIPNSVTSIGDGAFWYCSGLTSVTIPNSVTSMGEMAFESCTGLTSVTIGNSVTSIGYDAFYGCKSLASVTIPNSVTSIGDNAFERCSGLTSVTIGNSVESIGRFAFRYCSGLTSVTIPNSVKTIGQLAFYDCNGMTSLTISNSVTTIEFGSFMYCSGLTSVTIPNSVTIIEEDAFGYCSGLTSVTIGDSVEEIGDEVFKNCTGLTSVTIPNSVKIIGERAFKDCTGLTSVTIGNSVRSIENGAFYGCSKLLEVYCYAETMPSAFNNAFDSTPMANATLHVPAASIHVYKANTPWSGFGKIVGLSAGEPEVQKCATPVVTYAEGKLSFSCETEGANYVTKLVAEDAKEYYDAEIELSATYNIEVFATKANIENSDTVNVALVWVENGNVDEETGIISVETAPVLVQGNGGVLSVSGVAKGTDVAVYTISGTEVARATATEGTATISTGLQSGTIVVVKFGNKSVKVRI